LYIWLKCAQKAVYSALKQFFIFKIFPELLQPVKKGDLKLVPGFAPIFYPLFCAISKLIYLKHDLANQKLL
jgi:hypothetical protein